MPNCKELEELKKLIDNDSFLFKHKEGDFWIIDPDDENTVLLCRENGSVVLFMPLEDYYAIKDYYENKELGKQ